MYCLYLFFFKQKTAYEMRISDWSSDVCSSDLAAHAHKGTSFVEIFQNCIVYNKDVFADFTEKKNADLGQLWLEHGKPMLFAKGTKGLRLNLDHLHLEVVDIVDGDWAAAGVLVHDERHRTIAQNRTSTRLNSSQESADSMQY